MRLSGIAARERAGQSGSNGHAEKSFDLVVCFGDTTIVERGPSLVHNEGHAHGEGPRLGLIDRVASAWEGVDTLRSQLSRGEVLSHWKEKAFEIA